MSKATRLTKQGQIDTKAFRYPYQQEKECCLHKNSKSTKRKRRRKNCSIFSHFPQQPAHPVSSYKPYSCLFLTNGKQENHGPLGINILILLVKHQNGNSGNN